MTWIYILLTVNGFFWGVILERYGEKYILQLLEGFKNEKDSAQS